MKPIIQPVDRKLIINELTPEKYIRDTNRGGNMLYEVSAADSPNIMREIGRLREISFRSSGGGTGKDVDIDEYDTDPENPYKQLIVWDPDQMEVVGGYRYIDCSGGLPPSKMATSELFNFSKHFVNDMLPYTIELGRSFVQPLYQRLNLKRKGIFALDNLWDGLGALTIKYDTHRYFFGKVTMYSTYNVKARNILLYFLNHFFPDKDSLVTPIEPLDTDASNPYYASLFEGMEYKEAYKQLVARLREMGEMIPPLINSYMSLSPSMRVFGTSVNKEFGGVEETGILMNIEDIYPEKIERHIASLKSLRDKIKEKYRWWRR
ncbi:MAG TPA: GNAT family N-acetyltransferase [Bacteroidales bacterium]|nr:GNAT family N-acetyltransferase [Bacteroidales bacterium]HPK30087.1 GNAT family N-acetyltransferase [Bacteroidales bacterium]